MPLLAESTEYWTIVVFAVTVTLAAVVFLRLSEPPGPGGGGAGALVVVGDTRTRARGRRYPTSSGTYDADCSARMVVTQDMRLAVRVRSAEGNGQTPENGALMLIDTAHDFNALTAEQDARWPAAAGEDAAAATHVTLVTSEHLRVRERALPPGLFVGSCAMPSLRQRTVVLPSGIPAPFSGVLGRPFLSAPNFLNVLLDLPNQSIHFNVDPRVAAPAQAVIRRTTARDAGHGLFLVEATVRARGHEDMPLHGRFILDTGAPRLVVAQSTAERLPWLRTSPHGRRDALDMSGHRTETRVHECAVQIAGDSGGAAGPSMPVSFVVAGAEAGSILNDGHSDGLLGVACLRGMRVLWDNDNDGALVLLRN